MAKTSETITLGLGDLSVNSVDVGYLGGEVVFTATTESRDFRIGMPQHSAKRVITGFEATIKASLAQIDITTLHTALGFGSVTTPDTGKKRLSFGTSWDLDTLTNVRFVHTREDGKTITICFPKAQVRQDSNELRFSNEAIVMQDITIAAIFDSSSSAYPLGYVEFDT